MRCVTGLGIGTGCSGADGNFSLALRYALGTVFDAFAEYRILDQDVEVAKIPVSLPSTGSRKTICCGLRSDSRSSARSLCLFTGIIVHGLIVPWKRVYEPQ